MAALVAPAAAAVAVAALLWYMVAMPGRSSAGRPERTFRALDEAL